MSESGTLQRQVRLAHPNGLHLRPIQLLVQAMSGYTADVNIRFDGKVASAKSTMDLMLLGASSGAELNVEANGNDAESAVDEVVRILGTPPD